MVFACMAAVVLACLMPDAPASAASCVFPDTGDVRVSIHRNNGEVVFNNARSREGLRRLQIQNGKATAFGAGWTPVGLTLTDLKYRMRLEVEALALPSGGYCARLISVDADLGYDRLKVYIARKYRPGTCAYRSVSAHEMTHVAVFRDALKDFYPRLQHRLTRAAQQMAPIKAASPDRAASYLKKRLSATVQPLFAQMNRTLDRNNARLDTPDRYRSEQALCADW